MTINYVIGLYRTIQEFTTLYRTVHDNIRKCRTIHYTGQGRGFDNRDVAEDGNNEMSTLDE